MAPAQSLEQKQWNRMQAADWDRYEKDLKLERMHEESDEDSYEIRGHTYHSRRRRRDQHKPLRQVALSIRPSATSVSEDNFSGETINISSMPWPRPKESQNLMISATIDNLHPERPRILLHIDVSWTDEEQLQHQEEIVLHFWHGNIKRSSAARENHIIRWIKSYNDLNGASWPSPRALAIATNLKNTPVLEVSFAGVSWEDGSAEWAFNLNLADKHLGPHANQIAKIRHTLRRPHTISLLICDTVAQRAVFDQFFTRISHFQQGLDPMKSCWGAKGDDDSECAFLSRLVVPDKRLPGLSMPPQITYSDGRWHAATTEVLASIFEIEYSGGLADKATHVKAKFAAFPGDSGKALLMLLDTNTIYPKHLKNTRRCYDDLSDDETEAKIRQKFVGLKVGDKVAVWIHALQGQAHGKQDWTGTVQRSPRYAQPDEVAVLIRSPLDNTHKTEHVMMNLAPISPSIVQVKSLSEDDDAHAMFRRTHSSSIDITVVPSSGNKRRLERVLRAVDDRLAAERTANGGSPGPLELIYCCKAFHKLKAVDFFAGIPEQYVHDLEDSLSKDPEHLACLGQMKHAPAGLGLIKGFAGTGKTTLMARMFSPHLRHSIAEDERFKLLVASPVNATCDELCKILNAQLSSCKADLKIYRAYTPKVEREIVYARAKASRYQRCKAINQDELQSAINSAGDQDAAQELMAFILQASCEEHESGDQRATGSKIENSIGWHLLYEAGLLTGSAIPQEPALVNFARMYRNYANPDFAWTPSHEKNFEVLYSSALKYVLTEADVIVSTIAVAIDECLEGFEPTHGWIDEAFKTPTDNTMGFLAMHRAKFNILSGDLMQTKPFCSVPTTQAPFASQLLIPLYDRLIITGFAHGSLTQQYRFPEDICTPISQIFCNGELKMSPNIPTLTSSHIQERAAMISRLGIESASGSCCIELSDTRIALRRTSKANPMSCAAIWTMLERVILRGGSENFDPSTIAIVTPYKAQVITHEHTRDSIIREHTHQKKSFAGFQPDQLREIKLTTVDTSQGSQRKIVIFDAVSTSSGSILEDPRRWFVAASRASSIMIFVVDMTFASRAGSQSCLGEVMSYYEATRSLKSTDKLRPYESLPVWKHVPRFERTRGPRSGFVSVATAKPTKCIEYDAGETSPFDSSIPSGW